MTNPVTAETQIDPVEGRLSWRDHLRVHPAADLFPPMSESELRALGEDIKKNGLRYPVILWRENERKKTAYLLDGRNRLDAMELVGVPVLDGDGKLRHWSLREGEPYDLVLSLNVHRRHLTGEQKRELIAKILKAKPEASNAVIAKQTKADDKTVAKVRRKLESTSEIPRLEKTTGADGRQRKARPKKPPKPVDRRVTESPEISLEQRRAENAELDLSAEERAAKASPDDRKNHGGAARRQEPSDDAESDDVADAATVEEGVMHTLMRMNAHARMFRKFFKLSSFDREAEARISTAIDRMIKKWRLAQATLTNERRRAERATS